MISLLEPTQADQEIRVCLQNAESFSVVAGAGSGKTTSLVASLSFLRDNYGADLRRNGQKIVCITYTNRATAVIEQRLGFDDLFIVSTIHSFLWSSVQRFTKDIREVLHSRIIPSQIQKNRDRDNGGGSQTARRARERIAELENDLNLINQVTSFKYDETQFSNFSQGLIGHDDVISVATAMISNKPLLQRGIGFQFPYIFVDEAQDTFDDVITAFNDICKEKGLPLVGYFGDPMQQIYDNGSGLFKGPDGYRQIDKQENFRSATSIVTLTNKLRTDIQQIPAGENSNDQGSVLLTLIPAECPSAPRGRYTSDQIDRALANFDIALDFIDWQNNHTAKRLFLVRQMIARRLGFSTLQNLFTGQHASTKAQDDYNDGKHFLLKPFVDSLCPLIIALKEKNGRKIIDILKENTPAFNVFGLNKDRTLKEMLDQAHVLTKTLLEIWNDGNILEVLRFSSENNLFSISDRLEMHLARSPRTEEYDVDIHSEEKSDWLADEFFKLPTNELIRYYEFVSDHTPLSTQHGSKGEEYEDVLVVFDDAEAGWTNYSFSKLLTPNTSGEGTEGQLLRSKRLAYVCFSRACKNLRIFLYSLKPEAARSELVSSGLLNEDQINILPIP